MIIQINKPNNPITQQPNNAFTLIELIVVIVIISILAAVSIANFGKSVDEAHKKEAFSNLNVISGGELGYLYENNKYFPFAINNLNDNLRNTLGISVYDNADWKYSVAANALTATAALATATATRQRGKRAGEVIWLAVTSNTANAITGKYVW